MRYEVCDDKDGCDVEEYSIVGDHGSTELEDEEEAKRRHR